MIGIGKLRYAGKALDEPVSLADVDRLGLSGERWKHYQMQLQELGVARIFRAENDVQFEMEEASISNGSSIKGYWYALASPEHQKVSLDSYRISAEDKNKYGGYLVVKPLKGHWYLYLFVNG